MGQHSLCSIARASSVASASRRIFNADQWRGRVVARASWFGDIWPDGVTVLDRVCPWLTPCRGGLTTGSWRTGRFGTACGIRCHRTRPLHVFGSAGLRQGEAGGGVTRRRRRRTIGGTRRPDCLTLSSLTPAGGLGHFLGSDDAHTLTLGARSPGRPGLALRRTLESGRSLGGVIALAGFFKQRSVSHQSSRSSFSLAASASSTCCSWTRVRASSSFSALDRSSAVMSPSFSSFSRS